jgi:hypothetical protein
MALVEFDFEQDSLKMLPRIDEDTITAEMTGFNKVSEHKRRKIVCKHWLLGLCHHGMRCDYLHRLDRNKMPPCKHGKVCKIKNCPLKHMAEEELEECMYYKQGFCYSGPKCNRRHEKRLPEECPMEAIFESLIQQANGKKQKINQPNDNYKVTLCNHWLSTGNCEFGDGCHYAHGEYEINQGSHPGNAEFLQDGDVVDPTRGQLGIPLKLPFAEKSKCQYYILQAPDLRSLAVSRRKGVWAIPTRMAAEMNAAFRASDHVVIFFCVRPLRGIYGVARMDEMIPPAMIPNLGITPEFRISWLRTMRVSLATVAQLKLGNTGMFVGRSSSDGRFDNRVGLELLLTAYRKPIWDWSIDWEAGQKNIRILDKTGTHPAEYYPTNNQYTAHTLPDHVLFPNDWIERCGLPVNEKGIIMRHNNNNNLQSNLPMTMTTSGNSNMMNSMVTTTLALSDFDHLYTGNESGFIICAEQHVITEMLDRGIMGIPLAFKDTVKIYEHVPLFIFDMTVGLLLGIFYATSTVTMNLIPDAFLSWDTTTTTTTTTTVASLQGSSSNSSSCSSSLPIQWRFRIGFENGPFVQIPIQDPEVYAALGDSMQTLGVIGSKETKKLAALFGRRFQAMMIQQQQNNNSNNRGGFNNKRRRM